MSVEEMTMPIARLIGISLGRSSPKSFVVWKVSATARNQGTSLPLKHTFPCEQGSYHAHTLASPTGSSASKSYLLWLEQDNNTLRVLSVSTSYPASCGSVDFLCYPWPIDMTIIQLGSLGKRA